MPSVTCISFCDEPFIELLFADAGLIASDQQDSPALGIECKSNAPLAIGRFKTTFSMPSSAYAVKRNYRNPLVLMIVVPGTWKAFGNRQVHSRAGQKETRRLSDD
jgi:hypothetical protein